VIDCKCLSKSLEPYLTEIIDVTEKYGNALHSKILFSKINLNKSEGFKIIRRDVQRHLPQVFEIIEKYVKGLKVDNMKIANCNTEKYCWFLRLYNKEGHFLDWHFDNNFSYGLRYTYVCNIYTSKNNESQFLVRGKNNRVKVMVNSTGNGVFYNGSTVKHAISNQNNNAVRIALIIPFYENDKLTSMGAYRKWARDITYSTLKL
tara:strand:+ start:1540 stop:2151 length:612 start_codon:yes stop_codon:yes gene_type:complete